MTAKTPAIALLILCSASLSRSTAALVNFSAVDPAQVKSASGQNFSYTVGAGPATGVLNVRLLSGDASNITAGASPDTTGFNAEQVNPNLAPALYEFTLSTVATFVIDQNESLTTYETNGFTLLPSGAWSVLSSSDVTTTVNGSTISFLGAGGANQQPPYGEYSIGGTGSGFDFKITDAPGLINYGSAISLDVVPEPGSTLLLLGGGLFLCLFRRKSLPAR